MTARAASFPCEVANDDAFPVTRLRVWCLALPVRRGMRLRVAHVGGIVILPRCADVIIIRVLLKLRGSGRSWVTASPFCRRLAAVHREPVSEYRRQAADSSMWRVEKFGC